MLLRERPLLELLRLDPPREPAAERLADVDAALTPERAPVAAALVARRAVDAALRALLRALVERERPLLLDDDERLDVLSRDAPRDDERLDVEDERLDVLLRDDDERRRPPDCAR